MFVYHLVHVQNNFSHKIIKQIFVLIENYKKIKFNQHDKIISKTINYKLLLKN